MGAALPWLKTGGVARSVFTLARVANELGLLDRPERRAAVYGLLGVPLLAPIALILLSLRLRKLAALVLIIVGLLGLGAGGAGLFFGAGQIGPPVAFVGGIVAFLAAIPGAFRPSSRSLLAAGTTPADGHVSDSSSYSANPPMTPHYEQSKAERPPGSPR